MINKSEVYYEYDENTGILSLNGKQRKIESILKELESFKPLEISINSNYK